MELRHLRYFVAVAEELHFGHAAARLHIAQPPLSQQIRNLETELGFKLFWRSNRRVELTSGGLAFLEGARRTLASADQAVMSARAADGGETAKVSIGFIDSAVYSLMPKILRAFRIAYPSVRVIIRAMSSAQQVEALERGEIQVGILRPIQASNRLIIEELVREQLVVALPKNHRLGALDRIHIRDLKDEAFVFFDRDYVPSVYDRIMGMFHRAGQMPNIVQEAGEQHTIIGLVAAGLGYTITAEGISDWAKGDVVYRPLVHQSAWIPMGVAWRRAERYKPVLWFVETARSTTVTGDRPTRRRAPAIRGIK